jgi:hypothetical protein
LYGIAVLLGITESQLRWWNLERFPSLRTNPRDLVVGWVLITEGEPMPTPTPRATSQPTPVPTQGPIAQPGPNNGGSGSDWTYAAYLTAIAWRSEALATYSDVGYNAFKLANATIGAPGTSPEELAAWIEEAELFYLNPSYAALDAHLAWLNANPAATCFRDAYQADQNLAAAYRSWLQGWFPAGGNNTGQGRAQIYALNEIERSRDALFATDWFSDCG